MCRFQGGNLSLHGFTNVAMFFINIQLHNSFFLGEADRLRLDQPFLRAFSVE